MIFILINYYSIIQNRVLIVESANILNCYFINITSSNSGGGISANNNLLTILISNCKFKNCKTLSYDGGSIYLNVLQSNIKNTCIYDSNSVRYGTGITTLSFYNHTNFINTTTFTSCGKISGRIGAWLLYGGICGLKSINNSECYSSSRESCGHFGENPQFSEANFIFFHRSFGQYLFGPYSSISKHYNLIFIHNRPSSSLIISYGNNYIYNSIFINNSLIYSLNFDINSKINYINCIGDTNFVGSQSIMENSTFINQNITFYNYLFIYNCDFIYTKTMNSIFLKKFIIHYYFLFILY